MISKNDITKLAKRILKKQRGLRDHQIMHPQREWLIGLLAGVMCLVAGGVWSAYSYNDISQRDIQHGSESEIKQTIYRSELVASALSDFQERSEVYEQLLKEAKSTPPPLPEPVPEAVESNEVELDAEETEIEELSEEVENSETVQNTEAPES